MQILNIEPNTQEWLADKRLNLVPSASEASAVMGASKYMTRDQLLDLKKGWQSMPADKFTELVFKKGHEVEDSCRPIVEVETLEDLPPVYAQREVDGILFKCSFDGYCTEFPWEHKQYNKTLYENVLNGVLEPHYYWQLEHQMLVAGVDKALFTVSDGTKYCKADMWYQSVPERRARYIAAIKQFMKDLAKHQIEAKAEKVEGRDLTEIPKVNFSIAGTDIKSNLPELLAMCKKLHKTEIGKKLQSDQDFADKDKLVKAIEKARASLKEKVAECRCEFVSFNDFESMASEIDSLLQKVHADGKKAVKTEKDRIKKELCDAGKTVIGEHIQSINEDIKPYNFAVVCGHLVPDFLTAMKNKRTIESIKAAVNQVVADFKVEADSLKKNIQTNSILFETSKAEHKALFWDLNNWIAMEPAIFESEHRTRVVNYEEQQAEKAKEQQEPKSQVIEEASIVVKETSNEILKADLKEEKSPRDIAYRSVVKIFMDSGLNNEQAQNLARRIELGAIVHLKMIY